MTRTLDALRVAEAERRQEYERFRATTLNLAPLEKVTTLLRYIADHREMDSDLEALVFLASRGQDITSSVTQVIGEWKCAEKEQLARYNAPAIVYNVSSGRKRRSKRTSPITANDISATSRVALFDFWSGRDEQQLTIDATMLRAVEWCQIGGFDHWWERLARETTEDVVIGGFEGFTGAFWLFAMCRSDHALGIMPKALHSALDSVTIPRIRAPLPWQDTIKDTQLATPIRADNIGCASAIIFAEHRLQHPTGLTAEAVGTIQRHYENGAWPTWTHQPTPSIEATAMAMHALSVTQPRGWEHMMAGASEWLLNVQHDDGFWFEAGTPDPVFLTVLVMDALSLSTSPPGPLTFRNPRSGPSAPPIPQHFRVAFSFPGEARQRIERIAGMLAQHVGREHIFYEEWYKPDLARPDLDTHLQRLYHDRSDLIVVVLCADYQHKDWCHLEWRAIRDLIKKRHGHIMFLRLDDAHVDGTFSIDGYIDLRRHADDAVARFIEQRLANTAPARTRATPAARHLLSEHISIEPGTTSPYDIGLARNEYVELDVSASEELDIAVCSPTAFRSWRSNGSLKDSLYHFRRVSSLKTPITAPRKSTYKLLLINKGKNPSNARITITAAAPKSHA